MLLLQLWLLQENSEQVSLLSVLLRLSVL
jgi:hypothetical protein